MFSYFEKERNILDKQVLDTEKLRGDLAQIVNSSKKSLWKNYSFNGNMIDILPSDML